MGITGDTWNSIELHIKLNSAPGVADGLVQFWVDGVQQSFTPYQGQSVYDIPVAFKDDYGNWLPADAYFDGAAHLPGIGNSGGTSEPWTFPTDGWYALDFDDFVMSTNYVGPTGTPPPPYCGDGSCNGGETCSSCPQDCGTCSSQNPIAWWKFDEGSGTSAQDSSGNGHTGTLFNGPAWVTGKYNSALSLDGVDDYVDCGNVIRLGDTDLVATVVFWAKGSGIAVSTEREAPGGFNGDAYIRITEDGYLCYSVDYSASEPYSAEVCSDGSAPTTQWNMYAISINGPLDDYSMAINNIIEAQSLSFSQGNSDWRNIEIGRWSNFIYGTDYFSGLIDDVRIYSRALNQSEILSLYQSGSCIHSSDIPPCDGCVSNTELDAFLDRWKVSNVDVTLKEIIEAIGLWKRGCS